jgi:hypothetical protein
MYLQSMPSARKYNIRLLQCDRWCFRCITSYPIVGSCGNYQKGHCHFLFIVVAGLICGSSHYFCSVCITVFTLNNISTDMQCVMWQNALNILKAVNLEKLLAIRKFIIMNVTWHFGKHHYTEMLPYYKLQPTRCIFSWIYSTDALHFSGGSSAHHQEHVTVPTASGIVNQYWC